ncbi:uncharacterized protein EV420DRAFT_1749336 [Desarmillaria tabescens]|uniref:Uncharacterized protein n=1 Tax=Armillaria tabescens TaxID=1929756 RepID=A0AA39K8U0_ARMTA|nr:uncharacterized protein EV420DRAFT_1749336 [Desarmillaria tabescens]KAK0455550.1 hypothetical protein EV420DRAFT_1749336 [Desarmillaria tabescens]
MHIVAVKESDSFFDGLLEPGNPVYFTDEDGHDGERKMGKPMMHQCCAKSCDEIQLEAIVPDPSAYALLLSGNRSGRGRNKALEMRPAGPCPSWLDIPLFQYLDFCFIFGERLTHSRPDRPYLSLNINEPLKSAELCDSVNANRDTDCGIPRTDFLPIYTARIQEVDSQPPPGSHAKEGTKEHATRNSSEDNQVAWTTHCGHGVVPA